MYLKVFLLGQMKVGKSSLLARFTHSSPFDMSYVATVRPDFAGTKIRLKNGQEALLQIWDLPGYNNNNAYQIIDKKEYYKNTHVCILVCDMCDKQSFLCLEKLHQEFVELNADIVDTLAFVLLINKAEPTHAKKQQVFAADVIAFCNKRNIRHFYETSAMLDTNVLISLVSVAHLAYDMHCVRVGIRVRHDRIEMARREEERKRREEEERRRQQEEDERREAEIAAQKKAEQDALEALLEAERKREREFEERWEETKRKQEQERQRELDLKAARLERIRLRKERKKKEIKENVYGIYKQRPHRLNVALMQAHAQQAQLKEAEATQQQHGEVKEKQLTPSSSSAATGSAQLGLEVVLDSVTAALFDYIMPQIQFTKPVAYQLYLEFGTVLPISWKKFSTIFHKSKQPIWSALAHRIFAICDVKKSGTVEFEDFIFFFNTLCHGSLENRAKLTFRFFDYYNYPFITCTRLITEKMALEYEQQHLSAQQRFVFDCYDTDEQQFITRDEIRQLIAAILPSLPHYSQLLQVDSHVSMRIDLLLESVVDSLFRDVCSCSQYTVSESQWVHAVMRAPHIINMFAPPQTNNYHTITPPQHTSTTQPPSRTKSLVQQQASHSPSTAAHKSATQSTQSHPRSSSHTANAPRSSTSRSSIHSNSPSSPAPSSPSPHAASSTSSSPVPPSQPDEYAPHSDEDEDDYEDDDEFQHDEAAQSTTNAVAPPPAITSSTLPPSTTLSIDTTSKRDSTTSIVSALSSSASDTRAPFDFTHPIVIHPPN